MLLITLSIARLIHDLFIIQIVISHPLSTSKHLKKMFALNQWIPNVLGFALNVV